MASEGEEGFQERHQERAYVLRLLRARGADVLIETYPPGHMDYLGLGYGRMEAENPGLVYASLTPFGQTGPYKDFKSSDLIGFAMGATVANTYGWFQVWGRAEANVAASFAANNVCHSTTLAGTIDDSGDGQILNCRSETAIDTPATGTAYVDIWYPSMGGDVKGLVT